jgi:hypothetical protein
MHVRAVGHLTGEALGESAGQPRLVITALGPTSPMALSRAGRSAISA